MAGPDVIKLTLCSAEQEIHSDNIKIQTVVGISIFIVRKNSCSALLSILVILLLAGQISCSGLAEHEKI